MVVINRYLSRKPYTLLILLTLICIIYYLSSSPHFTSSPQLSSRPPSKFADPGQFQWRIRKEKYPVQSMIPLPHGKPAKIPKIQRQILRHPTVAEQKTTDDRRDAIKATFSRGWNAYRENAWTKDELMPIGGGLRNFGNWAATLVDSLGTLWIMDMRKEFEEAVTALETIDFSRNDNNELNIFEITVRYLGGLLSAYDLSNGEYPVLLEKALDLGDMIYAAFDTPNRLPMTRWHWKGARFGSNPDHDELGSSVLSSEIGSLSLEFTRLSQLSGDPKFFDAIQRVANLFEQQQSLTKLSGTWPRLINAKAGDFSGDGDFTLGTLHDILPKKYMLLGGLSQHPRAIYQSAIGAAKAHLLFRPMNKDNRDILLAGKVHTSTTKSNRDEMAFDPRVEHDSCFVGGMVGIGAQIFNRPEDLPIARKLVDGCIWAYESMPTGLMPDAFHVLPCEDPKACEWSTDKWHAGIVDIDPTVSQENVEEKIIELRIEPGVTDFPDRSFRLRSKAIESIFILYRITGDESLREDAWEIFQTIEHHTATEFGNAALRDVTLLPAPQEDSMAPFWMAETMKYLYLIFSRPEVISLDGFVFNTEGHPFLRPR